MSEELSIIERFRESHHAVARMLAAGMSPNMVRQRTGRSIRSLTLLMQDPSFRELVAVYSERIEEKWDEHVDQYLDLGMGNMIRAESLIRDKLEADDEVPITVLDRISQGRADRFGYSKNSTLRVEHDFSSALDRAIARSDKAKLVNGQASELPPVPALERPKEPSQRTPPSGAQPSLSQVLDNQNDGVFKRRRVA